MHPPHALVKPTRGTNSYTALSDSYLPDPQNSSSSTPVFPQRHPSKVASETELGKSVASDSSLVSTLYGSQGFSANAGAPSRGGYSELSDSYLNSVGQAEEGPEEDLDPGFEADLQPIPLPLRSEDKTSKQQQHQQIQANVYRPFGAALGFSPLSNGHLTKPLSMPPLALPPPKISHQESSVVSGQNGGSSRSLGYSQLADLYLPEATVQSASESMSNETSQTQANSARNGSSSEPSNKDQASARDISSVTESPLARAHPPPGEQMLQRNAS